MFACLDLMLSLVQLALVDLKEMKPVARVFAIVAYSIIGLLLLGGGLIVAFLPEPFGWKAIGGLVISVMGLVVLVRMIYGLVTLFRRAA